MSATHPLSLTACCNRKPHWYEDYTLVCGCKGTTFSRTCKTFRKENSHNTNISFKPFLSRQKNAVSLQWERFTL